MTIKWVQQDPLVMNGEPFCYGSRLTVRQLLELRANGYDLTRILKDHPELRVLGIAAAYTYAADAPRALRRLLRGGRLAHAVRATPRRRRPACPAQYRMPGHRDQAGGVRRLTRAVASKDLLADGWYARSTHRESRMTDTRPILRHDGDPPAAAPDAAGAERPFDPAAPRHRARDPRRPARAVVDPEIGMNVVELALIKQIILGPDSTEIKMILTTPFCPYAGSMIAQVKEQTEIGRRARRESDPAGRALGSARRRPDVVIAEPLEASTR